MKNIAAALILPALLLAGCKKTPPAEPIAPAPAPAVAPAPTPAAAANAQPAELSEADKEMAKKKSALEFGTMEDNYINDAHGQWASGATASSTNPGYHVEAANGKPDGRNWVNNTPDVGFDWIEFAYAKPVAATETRLVTDSDDTSPESLTRVELQDTEGKWHTIWSGISDVKTDKRGGRTWFVRTFDKTPYLVKSVKYTFANNMVHGNKRADAAQLVGE